MFTGILAALAPVWMALKPVIQVIIQAVLPVLLEKLNEPDTLEISKPDSDYDARVRAKLRAEGLL